MEIYILFGKFLQEDVAEFLKREGDISAEEGVKRLDMLYKKYKKVEQQLLAQKLRFHCYYYYFFCSIFCYFLENSLGSIQFFSMH